MWHPGGCVAVDLGRPETQPLPANDGCLAAALSRRVAAPRPCPVVQAAAHAILPDHSLPPRLTPTFHSPLTAICGKAWLCRYGLGAC
jgi:hypothetical protein